MELPNTARTARLTPTRLPRTISAKWLLRPNPWVRRFPITASSAKLAVEAWVWSLKLKTSSSVATLP